MFDQILHAILILFFLDNEIKASEELYKKTEDCVPRKKEKIKEKEKPNLLAHFKICNFNRNKFSFEHISEMSS